MLSTPTGGKPRIRLGACMNQPVRIVRGGLLLVGISFLMCGLAFAQEESEAYDPFGECSNYYYGAGVPQSFRKAFECFQKADDDLWLILMTLNGEGTAQSVKKARELLTRAENKPEWRDSQWLGGAEDAVAEREKNPASLKTRLDPGAQICRFAPGPTNTIEVCWANFKNAMNAANSADLELIEAKLSPPPRVALYRLQDMFGKFQEADGMWTYQEHIGGTGRGTFAQFQEILDRSDFASLIKKVVKDHGLQRRSEQELQARDKELNAAYRGRIEGETPDIGENKEGFLDSARTAERLWIGLQEPWRKLCEELYRGEMPPEEIDRAIETELREARILEILCETTCDYDFSGVPLGYSTSRRACGNYHCALGDALLNTGDYDGAIKEYGELLRLKPGDAGSHCALGEALGWKKDWDGAIKEYREAIRLEPKNAGAHRNLAEAFKEKNDWDGAIKEYGEAIRLEPYNADAHLKLAEAFKKKNDWDGTIREYRELVRLEPNALHVSSLAEAIAGKKDWDGAIQEYRKAISLEPNDPRYHNSLADALANKKDWDGVIQEYREVVRLTPKNADAYDNLGWALNNKQDWDGAVKEFRAAIGLVPGDAYAHSHLGLALENKKDWDGAVQEYREAVRLKPGDAEEHWTVCRFLAEVKSEWDGAIEECREAIRLKPDHVWAHGELGWLLEKKKDFDGAIKEDREAIRLKPGWPLLINNLGWVLYEKGDLDAAMAEYRESLRLKPDDAQTHLNLGLAFDKKGDWEGAIREYREAFRLEPDPGGLHYYVGQALEHKGDKQAALNEYRQASEADPKNSGYRAAYDRMGKELKP